jgi:pyridoxal phosphate enzyme (YggS family)
MPPDDISKNLGNVVSHIHEVAERCGRSADDITLIAVSKTRSVENVMQAIQAGQKDFGENTVQDAMTKIPLLQDSHAQWHFIGHLQSKKARQIPGNFHWVHSIDSRKLAQKLSNAMLDTGIEDSLNCLIQVNVSAEQSKSGLQSNEVIPFIDALLESELPLVNWRGLMTIGVQGDLKETRAAFAGLRQLLGHCREEFGLEQFDQLSMGMSNDYPVAVEEGATMVRVGTAIFGPRKK